jgi:histidinol-phosphatase
MVCAATGEGCYRNGRRAHVSITQGLTQAMACYAEAASFEEHGRREAWLRIISAAGESRG